MNNTIQDETFGEITFDGLNWIRTEPVTMTIAGKTFELRTEIESPDLVYDWARLGKLKQETIDKIFNPELGGIHYVLSKLEKTGDHFSRAFLEGREMTQKSLEEVALRKLSEMAENEDRLSEIQLVLALVFNDRIEIKFNCNWYEQGIGYFVIPVNGDISMKPADMNMERLKKGLVNLGFVIKECRYQWFYVYSADIPSKSRSAECWSCLQGMKTCFSGIIITRVVWNRVLISMSKSLTGSRIFVKVPMAAAAATRMLIWMFLLNSSSATGIRIPTGEHTIIRWP